MIPFGSKIIKNSESWAPSQEFLPIYGDPIATRKKKEAKNDCKYKQWDGVELKHIYQQLKICGALFSLLHHMVMELFSTVTFSVIVGTFKRKR